MIGVDTNVLVRFLVCDDPKQAETVRRRLRKAERDREQLLIPSMVLLETIWVLESAYAKSRVEIVNAVEDLLQMPVFLFEDDQVAQGLIQDGRTTKEDLSDILIGRAATASGCEKVITFDKGAAKLPTFALLK